MLLLGATSLLNWSLCQKVWDTGFSPKFLDFLEASWITILPHTWGTRTPSCMFGLKAQILVTIV